ncbi:MAG: Stp1/IreP family PP2C-type Ser/Thr phosphatase [Clostridia bacterium]|nr:Stp1/IreP family PP2C-type Ser/Thr phosphatase [Clostridia bacterium]
MLAEAISHTGLVRPGNEDYYILDLEMGLIAVADGMGGHQAGEVASHLALNTLRERLLDRPADDPLAGLMAATAVANETVFRSSLSNQEQEGMGTTLTAIRVVGNKGFLVHIGDSRAYLYREGRLQHLTDDHSYVGELVRCGSLTLDEARHHPRRNVLTRALGTEKSVEVDNLELELKPGDRLLLCTDGLYEVISDAEIQTIIACNPELKRATQELLELALKRGGPDNITVVLALYE